MSRDLQSLATEGVARLRPYQPGKPAEALQRELGLAEVVKLASNENPLGPPEAALRAIAASRDLARYPDGNGFKLKQALAAKHDIDPACVTLGNGSNEVLELAARAFVTPRHQVIYSEHAFAVYALVTQAIGAVHVVVPASGRGHDLKALRAAVTDQTRLLFIANPNNPTGTWVNRQSLRDLLENLPDHVIVLVDEAYFEYARAEPEYPDCSLWLKDFQNLIVTRTFSKAYGLAGLRAGYALSHPLVADLLNRLRQPFNSNSLALAAAGAALEDTQYIARSLRLNEAGLRQLGAALAGLGLEFIPSLGNFICLDCGRPAAPVYEALLRAGVIVRPVANYGLPRHLRVSVGLKSENRRFIEALGEILARPAC